MNLIIFWFLINFKLNELNLGVWGLIVMFSRMRNGIIVNLNLCVSIVVKVISNKVVLILNIK